MEHRGEVGGSWRSTVGGLGEDWKTGRTGRRLEEDVVGVGLAGRAHLQGEQQREPAGRAVRAAAVHALLVRILLAWVRPISLVASSFLGKPRTLTNLVITEGNLR